MPSERQTTEERATAATAANIVASPRVAPRTVISGDTIQVEFRIEDLIRRIIPGSAASHCGGCYGCSGCNH